MRSKTNISSIILIVLLFITSSTFAQNADEASIRKLDDLERDALIKKDTAALFYKYWSPDMVVNTPGNVVVTVESTKALLKAGKIDYSFFDRVIEKITIVDKLGIVMGHEIVKPQGLRDGAGKTITRRFTNVWMDTNDGWRIVARQSTIINME